MTNEQKVKVMRLRRQGLGYGSIGQRLGISKNTIKTYCQRNGIGGFAAHSKKTDGGHYCKCCGVPIMQTPGRKEKKFCSDRCRMEWWNCNLDLVNRKAVYEFVCPTCGKVFHVYGNRNRKYCSHECYIAHRFGEHEPPSNAANLDQLLLNE